MRFIDTSSPTIELRILQNGQNQCPQRCAQRHQQCRKGREAPSSNSTELEGYRQILDRHAETWYVIETSAYIAGDFFPLIPGAIFFYDLQYHSPHSG